MLAIWKPSWILQKSLLELFVLGPLGVASVVAMWGGGFFYILLVPGGNPNATIALMCAIAGAVVYGPVMHFSHPCPLRDVREVAGTAMLALYLLPFWAFGVF